GEWAMEFIGIDVHKRDSQVCILAEGGEVVLEQRLRTQRERLAELLGKRPKARVLLVASTESEWGRGAWRSWATRWWWPTQTDWRWWGPPEGAAWLADPHLHAVTRLQRMRATLGRLLGAHPLPVRRLELQGRLSGQAPETFTALAALPHLTWVEIPRLDA